MTSLGIGSAMKHRRVLHSRAIGNGLLATVVGLAWLSVAPAIGADFEWSAPTGGNWSDAARWLPDPGVPGDVPGDRATFSASGSPYTVLLDSARQLAGLTLSAADATLRTAGNTLTVSGNTNLTAGTLEIAAPGEFLQTGGEFNLAGATVAGSLHLNDTFFNFTSGQIDGEVEAQDAHLFLHGSTAPAEFSVRGTIGLPYIPPQHSVTATATAERPLTLFNPGGSIPGDPQFSSIDNLGSLVLELADNAAVTSYYSKLINYGTMTIDGTPLGSGTTPTMSMFDAFVNESLGVLAIRRDLDIESTSSFGSLGSVTVGANARLRVSAALLAGFAGTLVIDPSAQVEISSEFFHFEGVKVTGALEIVDALVFENSLGLGDGGPSVLPLVRFRNSGIYMPVRSGNTFQILSKSSISASDPITGTIDLVNSALDEVGPGPVAQATIASTGRLSGSGSFEVALNLVNQGAIAPSAGEDLTLIQDLLQAPGGRLAVEFAAASGEIVASHLTVNGVARLDGVLSIRTDELLAADTLPGLGDEFEIVAWGSRAGAFQQVQGAVIHDPLTGNNLLLRPHYGEYDLSLVTTLLGDASGDGVVGAGDYAAWAAQLGQTGVNLTADFNLDQAVGAADYAIWAANFGQSLSRSQPVPEPGGALLLSIGIAAVTSAAKAGRTRGARRLAQPQAAHDSTSPASWCQSMRGAVISRPGAAVRGLTIG